MEWGNTLACAAKSDLGKIASSPKYSVLCQSYVGEPGNGIPAKKLPNEGVLGMECSRDARNIVRRLEAGSGRSGNGRRVGFHQPAAAVAHRGAVAVAES